MKLTNENYFTPEANLTWLDCSTYKNMVGTLGMKGCETRALAIATGAYTTPKTEALLVGSYVDAYFDNSLDAWKEQNRELIYTKASLKKGEPELLTAFKNADIMIERAKWEPLFMEYATGETQRIFTGHIAGVPIRTKLDVYNGERIVDIKTCASISKSFYASDLGHRLNFAEQYGYVEQAAFYQAAVKEETGKRLPFYLAVITKEQVDKVPHPRLAIIHIPDEVIDEKMAEIEEKIGKVWAILHGEIAPVPCGTCEHCADNLPLDHVIQLDQLLFEV